MQQRFLKRVEKVVKSLHKYIITKPSIGIILGSGLNDFINNVSGTQIPYLKIKGFPCSTVKGHSSLLKINQDLVVMAGRLHYYEGYSSDDIILPIFVLHKLGVKKLIITNAAGGINSKYKPGDIILIKDQLNLLGSNPLVGDYLSTFGPRFVDMSNA